MANHLRRQIREAAAAVVGNLATTGTRVFQSRARLLQASDLPCLRVYCDKEAIQRQTMGPGGDRRRELELVIEGCVAANVDFDDVADQIAKEVAIAIDGNSGLGGLVKFVEPREFEIDSAGDAELVVAIMRMRFAVLYYAAQSAPDVPR